MISRNTGVARIRGLIRSFENCSAAASLGWISRIGQGSVWAKNPVTFSSMAVLSSWVETIADMVFTPGSVTASMGPRATSTVEVRQSPEVLPASRASLRNRSAQSGTLILGGGVQPRRIARRMRSIFPPLKVEDWLAKLVELFVDVLI